MTWDQSRCTRGFRLKTSWILARETVLAIANHFHAHFTVTSREPKPQLGYVPAMQYSRTHDRCRKELNATPLAEATPPADAPTPRNNPTQNASASVRKKEEHPALQLRPGSNEGTRRHNLPEAKVRLKGAAPGQPGDRSAFSFEIHTRLTASTAASGMIHTPHGDIQTPCFVPVATQVTMKAVTREQMETNGAGYARQCFPLVRASGRSCDGRGGRS